MTCRLATLSDVELLADLNLQLIQDEGHTNRLTLAELSERMTTWLRGDYRAVIFEEENGVVAYALYCVGERAEGDRFIFLRHFFVQRSHRRRGIGRKAMSMLFSDVLPPKSRVLLDVLSHNQGARDFWTKLGFKEHCLTMEWWPDQGRSEN